MHGQAAEKRRASARLPSRRPVQPSALLPAASAEASLCSSACSERGGDSQHATQPLTAPASSRVKPHLRPVAANEWMHAAKSTVQDRRTSPKRQNSMKG